VAFFGMMSPEQRQALRDAVRMVQVDEPPEADDPAEVGEREPAPQAEPEATSTEGEEPGAGAADKGR
jgi:hypothetical protein